MSSLVVRVFRCDPEEGVAPRFDAFDVPLLERMTILDVLAWIQRHRDASLGFRYACRVGMCGTCGLRVNGRERWACRTLIAALGSEALTIEPLRHLPVIKDLAVDMAPFFDRYRRVRPQFVPKPGLAGPARIAPDSRERRVVDAHVECITCGLCYSACTMLAWDPDFLGPAAINRAFALIRDSRDGAGAARLALVNDEHGIWRCHSQFTCTDVCPKHISPTDAVAGLRRAAVRQTVLSWFGR
jgi:succinate dehydrogenase/fumarate reductase iron-sulfur protein